MRRLDELADRYSLSPLQAAQLETLLDFLEPSFAPTSVHDRASAVDVHVADSLTGLEVPEIVAAERIADLGSGAGLPGLVLAAALPAASVVLVEAARRKARFIQGAAAGMRLPNVVVEWARAEEYAAGIGSFDVVCARALAALPVLCEYAAPLLRDGGTLVCWKGSVSEEEAADGRAAAAVLGLGEPEVVVAGPFRVHSLWRFRKIAPTPARFPRRAGMATKRPLSAKSS